MPSIDRKFSLALAAMLSTASFGCSDADADPAPRAVTLEFELRVNEEPFACGATYADLGTPPAPFTVTDARFYAHGFELLDAGGRAHPLALTEAAPFQGEGVALLDFEDNCGDDGSAETNTSVTGTVTGRDFVAVRFTLGVPLEKNFLDLATAAPPLDVTAMYWAWLSGYKFLKVDGYSPSSGGRIIPFFFHLGATCAGDNPQAAPTEPCSANNLVTYELEGAAADGGKIVADIGRLLETTDLSMNTPGTGPGCMSELGDPECAILLPRIGVDGAADQVLFHAD